MAEKYDEKEIREDYRKLTKLLIEKKMTITTMESADCIPDHGYGRLIGGAQRCLCHLLQRSEDHAGRSGRNH